MSINPFTRRSVKSSSSKFRQLSEQGWIEKDYVKSKLNSKITKAPKVSLKEHQEKVVKHFEKNRGLIAVHSLGSGKTITSIAASLDYLEEDSKRIVIVLSPASLEANFRKELEFYCEKCDPTIFERYKTMSYEKFSFNYNDYKDMKDFFLIVDEAHNLRTKITKEKGVRVKRILELSKKADKVLLLTATPFFNDPYDIINLVAIANKSRALITKEFFYKTYYSPRKDIFFKYFFENIISVYKPDEAALKKFYPSHTVNEVFIKMPEKYLKVYRLLERNSDATQMYYKNPNIFFSGLRQASNKIDDDFDSPKLEWVKQFLQLHQGEKTVIFSNWIQAGIKHLMKVVPNGSFMVIDGSTEKSERKDIVKDYNTIPEKNILLISRAGGEGIDLKNTRNVVILDPSWNNSVDNQVTGRAIRYGSHMDLPPEERHVNIYQLFLLKPDEHRDMTSGRQILYAKTENRIKQQERWSVDLYLRVLSKEKDQMLKKFMKENVIPYTIEQTN